MLLHASSPADIRVWEWIQCHLSHLFWPLVKLVASCSSTRMSPPRDPSTFRKFKLLCNECSFMHTWWSLFARSLVSRTEIGRSLELHQNITTNIWTRPFWKFGTKVNEVNAVTTISLSPERICPALLSWPCRWGVGHSNALWQGGPWCRLVRATCAPAPYSLYSTLYTVHCTLYTVQLYSWLCCNVNCVEMHNIHMCTPNVHFTLHSTV